MAERMIATASQTIGPYWHLIEHKEMADLLRFGATGEAITVTGRLTDGAGQVVSDAAIEIWQISPPASETFPAYGRSRTDASGCFALRTLKPGPVAGLGNAQQAPHLAITIMARGLLTALTTRLYFQDEPLGRVVEELMRYTPLEIDIEDESLRNLPVGGTFQTSPEGAQALLKMLEDGFGARIRHVGTDHVAIEGPVEQ